MKFHLFKKDDHIVRAAPRPRALRVMTGLFLTGLAIVFMMALGVVDRHSRAVGWNQHRQEFSVSFSNDAVRVTLLGVSRSFTLQPVYRAEGYLRRYQQGMDTLQPAPVCLAQSVGIRAVHAQGWRIERAVRLLRGFIRDLPSLPKIG